MVVQRLANLPSYLLRLAICAKHTLGVAAHPLGSRLPKILDARQHWVPRRYVVEPLHPQIAHCQGCPQNLPGPGADARHARCRSSLLELKEVQQISPAQCRP